MLVTVMTFAASGGVFAQRTPPVAPDPSSRSNPAAAAAEAQTQRMAVPVANMTAATAAAIAAALAAGILPVLPAPAAPAPPAPPPAWWEQVLAWLPAFAVAVALGLVGFMYRENLKLERAIKTVEQQAGATIGKPRLGLSDIAKTFGVITQNGASVVTENKDLRGQIDRLQSLLQSGAPGGAPLAGADATARLAIASRTALADAMAWFERLKSDPEFAPLDQSLNLRDALRTADERLKQITMARSPEEASPTAALRSGEFDTVLTLAPFLDAYFPAQEDWYAAGRAIAAVEALIRCMLAREGVEVYAVRPLTRLRTPRAEANPLDLRNIRGIGRVRMLVRQKAAILDANEFLVVDCSAPGYIIPGLGSTPPRLALYNPSAWT